jgi:hypothetical protein
VKKKATATPGCDHEDRRFNHQYQSTLLRRAISPDQFFYLDVFPKKQTNG